MRQAGAVEAQVGGAGAGAAQRALMLDSADLYLGDLRLTNQRIVFLQSDIYKGFPSNGVIGYSIFGHYVTELDYDKGTITLRDTTPADIDSSWASVPLYFKDNRIPWVDVSVAIGGEAPKVQSDLRLRKREAVSQSKPPLQRAVRVTPPRARSGLDPPPRSQ